MPFVVTSENSGRGLAFLSPCCIIQEVGAKEWIEHRLRETQDHSGGRSTCGGMHGATWMTGILIWGPVIVTGDQVCSSVWLVPT